MSTHRRIVDTEDSFPTGAIRKAGRLFMHPDIVNLQHLHGRLLNVKYLLIARNTTVTNCGGGAMLRCDL